MWLNKLRSCTDTTQTELPYSSQNVRLSSKLIPRGYGGATVLRRAALRSRLYGGPVAAWWCALSSVLGGTEVNIHVEAVGVGASRHKARGSRADTFRYHSIHAVCGSRA